jgi:predicted permease
MSIYAQIFTVIAPILFISLLGYIWSFYKLRYDAQFVSKIVMDVASPCLILATMLKADIDTSEVIHMTVITVSGLALLFVTSYIVIRLTGVQWRTYMSSLVFANTGNMGIPISLFAFGEHALALSLIIFMVTSLFHFSVGVSIVGDKHPFRILMTSPVFYATALAFFFLFTDLTLPPSIFNTVKLLGDMAIPLMIFSLGVSLHSLKLSSFKRSLFFGIMRLAIGFVVGLMLCWIFDLQGAVRGVVMIQSAMPSAVFNYLLALNFNREKEEVAGVVVCSTILSFLTLPLLLWFLFQS